MRKPKPRRGGRLASALATAAILGGGLSACGSGGASLAQRACADVNRSIALYRTSKAEPPGKAARTKQRALVELRHALRPAALAGSAGGEYQALKTTLSESSRVPEGKLISALTAQCAAATSGSS